jgi:hypothetical protein
MRQIGSVSYWFCSGAAFLFALFGAWNALIGKEGDPGRILVFCLGAAATFYLAGVYVRWGARKAEKKIARDA